MFFIGLGIVLVYTFFLIGIISKQHASRKKERPTAVDVLDMDGMGNQAKSLVRLLIPPPQPSIF
jgi:hypothetical protein